jgi:hypothetical protein
MSITDCGLMYEQSWCHAGPNPPHDSAWGHWLTGQDSPKLFGLRRGSRQNGVLSYSSIVHDAYAI